MMRGIILSGIDENQTKSKIFKEAAKLFSDKGYHAVSMREISERAKVTKPTIYYYFGSKEGIYKELVRTGIEFANEDVKQIINQKIPAKTKLLLLLKKRFEHCIKYPEYVRFFMTLFTSTQRLVLFDEFEHDAERHKQIFIKMIEEGIASGEFGAGAKPELAVEIFGAVMFHFTNRQLSSHEKILSDELAEDIVELLFKGLNE
ncbi:TetR family transcriptional regulator [candidate division KSB1 bacterium]|nr:TetR family transcriptional regulator [candidate division KSB1 bacterium]